MKAHQDRVAHAIDLFPAPAGALERVTERRRVVERNQRLRVGVLVSAVTLAASLFAVRVISAERDLTPAQSPDVSVAARAVNPAMNDAPPHTIVVVDLDGAVRTDLRHLPNDAFAPSLAPDGSMIAFVTAGMTGPRVATATSSGTDLRVLAIPVAANSPVWSPDGSRIAFVGWIPAQGGDMLSVNRDIYVMNADGSDLQRLTTSPSDDETPEWSPDGTRLVYAANPTSDEFSDQVEIWTVDPGGGTPERLTKNDVWDAEPAWSPDGRQIVYYSFADDHLWVMDADGSDQHPLTTRSPGFFAPQWAPDGSKIAGLGGGRSDGLLSVVVLDIATGKVSTVGTIGVHSDWNRVRWLPSSDALLVSRVDA